MNGVNKYKYEIRLVVLIIALILLLNLNFTDPLIDLIQKLIIIGDAVLIVRTLLQIWHEKWKPAVAKVARKAFVRVAKFFIRVAETLNLRSKKKNIISGETKIVFNIEKTERQKKVSAKTRKWKHLEDGRSKLRYLYRHTVSEQIKHGERIYATNTPSELLSNKANGEGDSAVYGMYVNYRYDERKEPSESDVMAIKETYFENLK
jgi:hypothetical protein